MPMDQNIKKKKKNHTAVQMILLFVFSGAIAASFSILYQKDIEEIERNIFVILMGTGTLIFMFLDAIHKETLDYDNNRHCVRFLVLFAICLPVAAILPLISYAIWPYLVIFVMLGLFSNMQIGLFSGAFLLMLSVLLEKNGGYGEFFLYLMAGAVALTLFRNLDDEIRVGLPTLISLLMLAVLLVAYHILFLNMTFSPEIFVLPVLNLIISLILLLILINIFSRVTIRCGTDMYMEVNDPEFILLVRLKEKNKEEYYRAIHTAYLAERIAMDLGLDQRAVKTCAYYHRTGLLEGTNSWETVQKYCREFHFPEKSVDLMEEYYNHPSGNVSTELAVVMVCETVVASIMYIFAKDHEAKISYDELIDRIYQKKTDSGEFRNSSMTLYEMNRMKELLKKEKLYYDFLR